MFFLLLLCILEYCHKEDDLVAKEQSGLYLLEFNSQNKTKVIIRRKILLTKNIKEDNSL